MIIVWLEKAIVDRDGQLDYIGERNVTAAIGQGDHIEAQVNMLADFPNMGRAGKRKATLELVIDKTPFIAVYRVKPRLERVEILRLLHSAQQWPPKKPRTAT